MPTRIPASQISLIPLAREHHVDALQQVYLGADDYWAMHEFPSAPDEQAARDLEAATEMPGRTMMGIVQLPGNDDDGIEMIGVVDFRLHWPDEGVAYVGMFMVAAPYRRQGIASQAWRLLSSWLAGSANIQTVRCGVEQFNFGALRFFRSLDFDLTGETNRVRVGDKLVRLLYMKKAI